MVSILIFLGVLSVLIFIHELGHFVAAKACNIYVERFSIGMPPRVAGLKVGETDYCIGALPIGGFVKMAGQEDAPLSEEEREKTYGHVPPERWFNNKPIWQRYIVILAGPLMNLVLGVVLYAVVAAMGGEVPESEVVARIGKVEPELPAMSAPLYPWREGAKLQDYTGDPASTGLKTGDFVRSIDGNHAENIVDLAMAAVLGGAGTKHLVEIERPLPDGTTERLAALMAPEIPKDERHPRFGVADFATPLVGKVLEDTPAEAAGLKEGDVVRRLDGDLVDVTTMIEYMEEVPEGQPVDLEVVRDGAPLHLTLTPLTIGRMRGVSFGPDNEKLEDLKAARPKALDVPDDVKEKTGLQRKDVIAEIDGEPATLGMLAGLIEENPGKSLKVKVERPAILLGLLQQSETLELDLTVDGVRAIGIAFEPRTVFVRATPAEVAPEAIRRSVKAVGSVIGTVAALVTGTVSAQDLGGPVLIYQLTTAYAERGFTWLLRISAFISINLCVFNLLPIPVLDGGLMVMNSLEAIRRKPLSVKFQERFQAAGLILVVGLMIFVTWNDVARWVMSIKP